MPGVSKDQVVAMRIAEHDPDKLYKRNRNLLSLTHQQMHDFASTPTKDLPEKKKKER
jgi:hypothetical protein